MKYLLYICLSALIISIGLLIIKNKRSFSTEQSSIPFTWKCGLIIKVSINGEVVNMVWDTGCGVTKITQKLAEKLDIKVRDNANCLLEGVKLDSIHSKNVFSNRAINRLDTLKSSAKSITLTIGDVEFNKHIFIDDINNYYESVGIDGVVGMDIIGDKFWVIDNVDSMLHISSEKFYSPKDIDNQVLNLNYTLKHLVPVCPIPIAGHTLNLTFDSGANSEYKRNLNDIEYLFLHDFIFKAKSSDDHVVKAAFDIAQKGKVLEIHVSSEVVEMILCKNVAISQFTISTLILPQWASPKSLSDGYISNVFMKRFHKIYFNPEEQSIQFVLYPGQNTIRSDKDIEPLFQL